MNTMQSYAIVGNGIAAVSAAEVLRAEHSTVPITLIADDAYPVYYRPALKDFLAGKLQEQKLWARPQDFYERKQLHTVRGRVTAILPERHLVQLGSGQQMGYSHLLLASGARPVRLNCPGADLVGVTTLRTVEDYRAVVSGLKTARRIVVVGGGTLALETVETLWHRGYLVTHLVRNTTLWSEVLDQTAADLVMQQERRDGVNVWVGEEVAEIRGTHEQSAERRCVREVVTTRGARIPCDLVLVAIGVEPNIDFIQSSGILCGKGVRVNRTQQTNVPDIYAIGDVVETRSPLTGQTRIIGQWYPAIQQARTAAYHSLDLLDMQVPFQVSTFYNATFLYGLVFAAVGQTKLPDRQNQGYRELVADPQPRVYRKVVLKDGIAVGALALGDRTGVLALKRAIDQRIDLSPVAAQLFDATFRLDDWLDQQGVPRAPAGVSRAGEATIRQVAYAETHYPTLLMQSQPQIEGWLVPQVAERIPGVQEVRLSQTRVMAIGRKEGVYLCIDHPSISRDHAEISYANGCYILHDLHSRNGTSVNAVPLVSGGVALLRHNDRVQLGKIVQFEFQERQTLKGQEVK